MTEARIEGRSWAVVGGGLLGMTLAHRLAGAGARVTMFEAAPELGGLASAWTLDGVTWDRHYHVILWSDLRLRGLLKELGLEAELEWRTARTGVFAGGRLHSVSNPLEFLLFPTLGLVDKARLAATILVASRVEDGRPLESIRVEDWARRWSGDATFERFWRPLLRSKLGDNYKLTSAAFLWATIRRLYAARRAGLDRERFGYVRGGYARILGRFGEVLAADGVDVRLGARVTGVAAAARGRLQVRAEGARPATFDGVLVTAPAPVVPKLCSGLSPDEVSRLEGIRYQGIVCASLLLDRPLGGFYVTNLLDDGLPFTGVIETSSLVDRDQFGGRHLVYLPRYVTTEDPFLDASDDAVRTAFLDGLRRLWPDLRDPSVRAFRVSRVRHVMPLPTLGYSARLPPFRTTVPGLYVATAAHIVNGTLNVNETVGLAERAFGALVAGRDGLLPEEGT